MPSSMHGRFHGLRFLSRLFCDQLMRIFFSVGEPSGDLHAANLIQELKQHVSDLQVTGYGGPRMAAAGCDLHYDLTQLAVMFLSGAVKNLATFLQLIAAADRYFEQHAVDAVVLINYSGFNWWIARKAKKHGIPVFFYGVPQMWAWAPGRIRKVRKYVDYVICKLPFEKKWFADRGCEAHYVGHPYFDELCQQRFDQAFVEQHGDNTSETVLLLPGSRGFEVERNLGTLIAVAGIIKSQRPGARIVMGCLNATHQQSASQAFTESDVECEVFAGRTQELMKIADACVACSGSVSLELLYHRLPTVIVYKISRLKMLLQPFVLKCRFITLPNLMTAADIRRDRFRPYDPDAEDAEPVLMPEYLTTRDCSAKVARHVLNWIASPEQRIMKQNEMDQLAKAYAFPGASKRAARFILSRFADGGTISGSSRSAA